MADSTPASAPAALNDTLRPDFSKVRSKHAHRLRELWQRLQKSSDSDEVTAKFTRDYLASCAWVAKRTARVESLTQTRADSESVAQLSYDESLPITGYVDELIKAIQRHRVIIVAGETGSGKSTQLPKICLSAGRGQRGLIACTQPRRIAAKTVARRVASELQTELGDMVGWQVRFTDVVSDATMVKFMTDGILLAETQTDNFLSNYDTIIIDEAHERSLNIDFLLGFLKRLLARRADLKLIITSATIDTDRFAQHFDNAPVFKVEGRGFPVEIRYRPMLGEREAQSKQANKSTSKQAPRDDNDWQEQNLNAAVIAAIEELNKENALGDVLVFFPGEREIRECQQALQRRNFRETEVLPLYARLSNAEQDRVFAPESKRRIVLASNVAETSITVPRIRFVIDTGVARIARYSPRSKIERLHIEAISQASANQRAGRCGRIAAGVCVRLYDESDFNLRPAFTDPEILRSSLAGVLLRMMRLRLGDPRKFPFVEAPDERAINDGYLVLQELGAVRSDAQHGKALTEIGRQMAELPIDVHYARMLVAAVAENCLREVLIIASALSIQDPRERPADARGSADAAHATFADESSDFLSLVRLWEAYQFQSEALSNSQLRDWCKRHFLSFLRMREWRDLHSQLQEWAREHALAVNAETAKAEHVHRALLSAFIAQIGEHDEKGVYRCTRGRKFQIFPGSAVKGNPRWVMADTLLDTQKVWAIGVAKIEPLWLEKIGAHLIKKRHYDPHWDARSGRVMGYEDQNLLGLPVVLKRRVQFEAIDPAATRELFMHHVFGLGEVQHSHRLFAYNQRVREEARGKEEKLRTRGLLRSASEITALYESKVPAEVRSLPALLQAMKSNALLEEQLRMRLDDFVIANNDKERGFPDELRFGAQLYDLRYHFDPSSALDGVSIAVKLDQLGTLSANELDWLVPGLRDEKVQALIKSLPKHLRRMAVPAPDFARAFLEAHPVSQKELSLVQALAEFLSKICGAEFGAADFDKSALPAHLQFRIEIVGPAGEVLEQGRDLQNLQAQFRSAARKAFTARMGELYNRDGIKSWPFDLPDEVRGDDGSLAFPALLLLDGDVKLRAYATREEANLRHPLAVLQLLRLHLPDEQRYWRKHIAISPASTLVYASVDTSDHLRLDIVEACLREIALEPALSTRSTADFHRLAERVRNDLGGRCQALAKTTDEILNLLSTVKRKLKPPLIGYGKANFDDIEMQLSGLVYKSFILDVDGDKLANYQRYLKALGLRVDRLLQDAVKDQQKLLDILPFRDALQTHSAKRAEPAWQNLRWALEELRVSIFAPEIKTGQSVSVKRLMVLTDALKQA